MYMYMNYIGPPLNTTVDYTWIPTSAYSVSPKGNPPLVFNELES